MFAFLFVVLLKQEFEKSTLNDLRPASEPIFVGGKANFAAQKQAGEGMEEQMDNHNPQNGEFGESRNE